MNNQITDNVKIDKYGVVKQKAQQSNQALDKENANPNRVLRTVSEPEEAQITSSCESSESSNNSGSSSIESIHDSMDRSSYLSKFT